MTNTDGDEPVLYQVIRKPLPQGKAKKITIRVHPDSQVVVTVPEDTSRSDIHGAVIKRAKWIWDAMFEFRSHQQYVQIKNYVSGEMQFYLGRRYMLKVVENKEAPSSVKMDRGKLLVTLPSFDQSKPALVRGLINEWYKLRAERIFHERLNHLLPQASWVKGIPSFRTLPMQKQWGSCSAKGALMLNPHLLTLLALSGEGS